MWATKASVALTDWASLQQNLGAMVRSAYFFGVKGVLLSTKNCAPLSAVASKASAGTLEDIAIYDSKNLMATLELAAEVGYQVR